MLGGGGRFVEVRDSRTPLQGAVTCNYEEPHTTRHRSIFIVTPGPDQARTPNGAAPHKRTQPEGRWKSRGDDPRRAYEPTSRLPRPYGERDMTMVHAWAINEAVLRHASSANLSTREWRLLTAVLLRIIRWQRFLDRWRAPF